MAMSHAWFDALDRFDRPEIARALEPAFVQFEEGRFYDGPSVMGRVDGQIARGAPRRTRTWREERVYPQPGVAVFIGEAVEHMPADSRQPSSDVDGWNTLVWVPDADGWKLASWQWQPAGLAMERVRWNEIYRTSRIAFRKEPNALLMATIADLRPGTALDLAMGQGRNAIYLASRGWKVTGVDISDEGIHLAQEAASARGLAIATVQADMTAWDFGTEKWDLITFIYAGDDPAVIEKIKRALKRGGEVVVEFFHRSATGATGIGAFTDGELAKRFGPGFDVLRDEVVDDVADWGERPARVVRFVARKR